MKNKILRVFLRYMLCMILGISIITVFPPTYFVIIGPIAFAIISMLFYSSTTLRESLLLGFFVGFGFGMAGFYWFFFPVEYVSGSTNLSFLAVVGAGLIISVFYIITALLSYFVPKNKVWSLMFFNAAIWSTCEIFKGIYLFGGVPWNMIAGIWYADIYMMQIASLVGVYGLGFITYLCMSTLLIFFNKNSSQRDRVMCLVFLVIFLGICHFFGYYRVSLYNKIPETNTNIAIIQPNISQLEKMTGVNSKEIFNNFLLLNKSLSSNIDNLLIIWPETFVEYYMGFSSYYLDKIRDNLFNNATIIMGVDRQTYDNKYYNSALVYNPYKNFVGYYNKIHLVPFGEYFPLVHYFTSQNSILLQYAYSRGDVRKIYKIQGVPSFSILICFEAIFPNHYLNNQRLDFLVNIANDAWYDRSSEAYQHVALTRFRTIEGGLPMVRSSNRGIGGVIDSVGRIKEHLDLLEKGYIIAKLPAKYPNRTIFSIVGNKLVASINFIILFILFFCIIKERGYGVKKRFSKNSH